LLHSPKKYAYVQTTEGHEACPEQADTQTNTDKSHRYQGQDLPPAAKNHVAIVLIFIV